MSCDAHERSDIHSLTLLNLNSWGPTQLSANRQNAVHVWDALNFNTNSHENYVLLAEHTLCTCSQIHEAVPVELQAKYTSPQSYKPSVPLERKEQCMP